MNEKTIIQPDDVRKIRAISENISDWNRINPYILETETLDLLPMLGANLYEQFTHDDLIKRLDNNEDVQIITDSGSVLSINKELWTQFIEGGYYTYKQCNQREEKKYFPGLAASVSYIAYSRLLPNQNINVTAFGVVRKTTSFSDPSDEATIFRSANEAKKIGLEYMRQTIDYLKSEGYIDDQKKITNNRYKKFKAIG